MRKSFSFLFPVLFLSLGSSVAPALRAAIEKDLGQALAYVRITDVNADAAIAVDTIERRPALVLDLRSLTTANDLPTALHAALAKPPAPHAARILLINATTSPALVAAITETLPSVVTIGTRSTAQTTDIAVAISDEEDLSAYTALSTGTPLEKLINNNHDKPRYDEARLVHDHANGISPADAALPAGPDDDSITTEPAGEKKPSDTEKKTPPAIDLVLERAVQLHRSLLALKKL